MSKRTHQYHGSWFKFSYEFVRHLHEEVIEAALDEYCRHAFYFKPGRYFFMIQKKDALRLRLKGFLRLNLPLEAEKNIFPESVYPTQLDVSMVEKNTKSSELAKEIRQLLPNFKIKSFQNSNWKSNGYSMTEKIFGTIDVHLPNQNEESKKAVMFAIGHWIKDGTLVDQTHNPSCMSFVVL